jgi:hypothetical protein
VATTAQRGHKYLGRNVWRHRERPSSAPYKPPQDNVSLGMTVPTKASSFAADLRQSCVNIMQADDGHFPQIAGIREYVDSRIRFQDSFPRIRPRRLQQWAEPCVSLRCHSTASPGASASYPGWLWVPLPVPWRGECIFARAEATMSWPGFMAPRSWPFGLSWSLPAARHWRPSPTKVKSRAGLGHNPWPLPGSHDRLAMMFHLHRDRRILLT